MARLPKVKLRAIPVFPANVSGGLGVGVTKANGAYALALNVSNFHISGVAFADLSTTYAISWGGVTTDNPAGVFSLVPYSEIKAKATKVITAAGPYAALPSDEVLIIKQAVGAPFTVTVDWSLRTTPLRIVDGKGDAATNNITITPAAGQTQLATVNYSYVIDGNGGSIILTPLPDGSGAF